MSHQQYSSCIDACNACASACDRCSIACLGEANPQHLARCIALDIDCAQACRLAAAVMARGSESADATCGFCAQLCDACAEECSKHAHEHCRMCAQACRSCADACRRMASQSVAAIERATAQAGR